MNDSFPRTAETELRRMLLRVQQQHAERAADANLAARLTRLADWQSRRLGQTYADLGADARYAAAVRFFQDDLYGPADFTRRDDDVARIVPLLVKLLPERVVATVAEAMELNALSQDFDRRMLAALPGLERAFSVAEYCAAFRRVDDLPGRNRQVALVVDIGRALDQYVKRPLIRAALAMMRGPAHLAGYGVMHDFLERGFAAFHRMHGAEIFLSTIAAREVALFDAIMAGDDAPFPDPAAPSTATPVT